MSDAQIPIFVGSTYLDLQSYRDAVREVLHRLEVVARGMEYFGATPDPPKEECLKAVRSCSAYIGIFGMRYGSVDPETGKSMTHLEYEHAQHIRLPSLIYMVDEHNQPILPRFVDTGAQAAKLAALKDELKARFTVSFFTTPDDLGRRISQDLPRTIERLRTRPRSAELERIIRQIPRIDWLDDERFRYLKEQAGPAAQRISADAILREVIEFLLSGDRQAASILIQRTSDLDFREAIDLAREIEESIGKVIKRGTAIVREEEVRNGS
jgi:hypothetical protein